MEEKETVGTPVTTPEQAPIAEAAGDDSQEPTRWEKSAESAEQEEQTVTTPEAEESAEDAQEVLPVPMTVPVRFRHKSRDLTMDEATKYAQMGLLHEAQEPLLDKLRLMAAGQGQSLEEFITAWEAADRQAYLEAALEKTGGDRDLAGRLLDAEMDKRRSACRLRAEKEQLSEEQASQNLMDRLADEYDQLRQEMPEMGGIETLPREVIADAVENGRHLMDAYLRYEFRENRKITANRQAQAAAAKAAVGRQGQMPPGEGDDPKTAAMVAVIRSVF